MKIGIDARLYGTKHRGLGRYVKKLVDGITEINTKNQYVIFFTKDNINEFKSKNAKVKKVEMNARWYSLKEQLVVPRVIHSQKVDLMHFPHFNVPLSYNQRFIVTIHDLIIDHFPDSRATNLPNWRYRVKLLGYKKILRHAVNQAEKIIVPSNFVKTDLTSLYQIPEDKIKVIYEGYFLDEAHAAADIARLGINKPFFLYVGAAYPHKNLEKLVESFTLVNKKNNYQLVLAGKTDEFFIRLSQRVNDHNIIFTGYVAEGELKKLYQEALLYVFPSLYEGFGLPAIEAQAHCLPVVSSNRSSMPEILGDSAIYFNPDNAADLAEKINMVISDHKLRARLIQNGLLNIKKFSWLKMISETGDFYQ